MENDVLKNKIAPWQEKGRWYHFRFENGQINTAKSDPIPYTWTSGSPYFFLTGLTVIDSKVVIENIDTDVFTTTQVISNDIRSTNTGLVGVRLGATYAQLNGVTFDLYIFAY